VAANAVAGQEWPNGLRKRTLKLRIGSVRRAASG